MLIGHISDLHFGISNYHNEVIERKLKEIAHAGVDHLIISGDITNSGSASECEQAVNTLDKYGFFSSDKLTVVPGNHDLFTSFFRQFKTPEDIYKNISVITKFFFYCGGYSLNKYKNDLSRFNYYYNPLFEGVIKTSLNFCGYPFLKYLDDDTVLIGLDSNAMPGLLHNPACSNGICDRGDYNSLKELLVTEDLSGKFKIVVMHNFLYSYQSVLKNSNRWFARFMETRKVERYINLFDQFKIDLVLHGHFHFNDEYYVGENRIKVLNGGRSRWGNWNRINVYREDLKTGT